MDPIAFQLGPLVFRWYGIIIVGGALIGAWVAAREARHRGENPEHVWEVFVWALLGGILGARLYHVFSSPAASHTGPYYYFVEHPFTTVSVFGLFDLPFPSALAIWEGGLGIYGGIAGGALVMWLYVRRHGLHWPTWFDIGAIGLLVGQAIGRWGNYFNQELYGEPTTLPWGIQIHPENPLLRLPQYAGLPADTRFHPTFLYESIWNLLAVGLLLWISRRYEKWLRPGDIFSFYLVLYGVGRFLVEFQRPDAWEIAGLPTAQWIGLLIALLGGVLIWWRHRGEEASSTVPYITRKETGRASRRRQNRERRAQG